MQPYDVWVYFGVKKTPNAFITNRIDFTIYDTIEFEEVSVLGSEADEELFLADIYAYFHSNYNTLFF